MKRFQFLFIIFLFELKHFASQEVIWKKNIVFKYHPFLEAMGKKYLTCLNRFRKKQEQEGKRCPVFRFMCLFHVLCFLLFPFRPYCSFY